MYQHSSNCALGPVVTLFKRPFPKKKIITLRAIKSFFCKNGALVGCFMVSHTVFIQFSAAAHLVVYYSAAMNANFAEHFCCWFYYYFKPDSPNLAGIRELPSNKIQLQFGLEGMAATRANFQLLRRALACSNKNIQKYVHICKNIIANIQT